MAAKQTLSKDEIWLEKAFGVDISKLDPKVQPGGKMHDDFLDALKDFHKAWDDNEDICEEALKIQPAKDDNKANLLHDLVLKDHKGARNWAQRGNPEAALLAIKTCRKTSDELLDLVKKKK